MTPNHYQLYDYRHDSLGMPTAIGRLMTNKAAFKKWDTVRFNGNDWIVVAVSTSTGGLTIVRLSTTVKRFTVRLNVMSYECDFIASETSCGT